MSDTETEQDESAPVEPDEDETVEPDEQDEQDEGAEEVPAPAPEHEPTPGITPEQMEKRFQAADKALAAYAKKIGDIYEEDALGLTECPLCPGIHKGFVNVHDAGRVPKDVADAVMMYLGFAREQEYKQDPFTRTCDVCGGETKTATGSHDPRHKTRTCPECKGYGYTPPPTVAAAGNGHSDTAPLVFDHTAESAELAERDAWGEPRILPDGRENPNYGKMPQFKVQIEPWGTTANLTAQDAAA